MTITDKDKAQQRQSSASSTARSQGSTTLLSGSSTSSSASNEKAHSDCAAYRKPKEYWPAQRQSAHAASGNKASHAGEHSTTQKEKPSDTKMTDASSGKTGKDGKKNKTKVLSLPSSSDPSSSPSSASSSDSSSDSGSEDEAGDDEELTPEEKNLIRIRRRKMSKKVTKMLSKTWPPNWDDIEAACFLIEVKWVCEDLNAISERAKAKGTRFHEAAPHPGWVFESLNRMQHIVTRYADCHTCTANPQHKAKWMAEQMIKSMRELIQWDHCGGTFADADKKKAFGGSTGSGQGSKAGRR